MSLFSAERVVQVGGGVSRIREDALIKDTSGITVSAAVLANQSITDALVVQAVSGTVSSYNHFNRYCKKSSNIGLPTTRLSGSTLNLEPIASLIRSDTGNDYPTTEELITASINVRKLTATDHLKFNLQTSYSYDLTTNVFTYDSVKYFLTNFVEIAAQSDGSNSGYNITGSRYLKRTTNEVATYTTTVTDPGFTNIHQTITYYHDYLYNPYTLRGSDSSILNRILVVPDTSDFSIYAYDINYIDNTTESGVVFVNFVKPANSSVVSDGNGNISTVPILSWSVIFPHGGNSYIWIEPYVQTFSFIEFNATLPVDDLTTYAPVVPVRNNKINYDADHEPLKYKSIKRALKIINIDPDELNKNITEPTIEDIYVTVFSNLKTDHNDQAAYNYAFFNNLLPHSIVNLGFFSTFDTVYAHNTLTVNYSDILGYELNYGYIQKTSVAGTLTKDYEITLSPVYASGGGEYIQWALNSKIIDYTIKKKTSPNTYDQIFVKNLSIHYVVSSSGNEFNAFVPDLVTSGPDTAQLVIPVSFKLAQDSLSPKELESFFLRSTHVGMFGKTVSYLKWYQQDWFFPVILIASLIYAYNTGDLQNAMQSIQAATFTAAELYNISLALAFFVVIAKFTVIQLLVKVIFTKLMASSDGIFRDLLKVAYIVASAYYATGNFDFSFNTLGSALSAFTEVEGMDISLEIADIQKEMQTLLAQNKSLEPILKEAHEYELKQQWGEYVVNTYNLFRKPSDTFLTPEYLELQSGSWEQTIQAITNYVEISRTIDPASLFIESQKLLNA